MKKNAFTLIEVLVAVGIFSLVMGMVSAILLSAISLQRKNLAIQRLLDQTSYVLEYMSRTLRVAKKQTPDLTPCISQNYNYEITRGGYGIKFIDKQDVCHEFYWDTSSKQLKEARGTQEGVLTPEELEVTDFKINLSGEYGGDERQPRVTILLQIKGRRGMIEEFPEIKIQTTISQRKLDIPSQ